MLPLLCAAAVEQAQSGAKPQTAAAPAVAPVLAGANLVNPQKPTPAALAEAKQHYSWDCAMCHGDTGKGDGSLAVSEHLTMPDFTNPAALASLKDGQIFTLIRNGQGQMPPEEKARANDATVWNLVNYLRSLSKPETRSAN
jgi:mono/diheme cytochrome c family protein